MKKYVLLFFLFLTTSINATFFSYLTDLKNYILFSCSTENEMKSLVKRLKKLHENVRDLNCLTSNQINDLDEDFNQLYFVKSHKLICKDIVNISNKMIEYLKSSDDENLGKSEKCFYCIIRESSESFIERFYDADYEIIQSQIQIACKKCKSFVISALDFTKTQKAMYLLNELEELISEKEEFEFC